MVAPVGFEPTNPFRGTRTKIWRVSQFHHGATWFHGSDRPVGFEPTRDLSICSAQNGVPYQLGEGRSLPWCYGWGGWNRTNDERIKTSCLPAWLHPIRARPKPRLYQRCCRWASKGRKAREAVMSYYLVKRLRYCQQLFSEQDYS